MLNKLERVRNVVELQKSGDINQQTALDIIDKITSHQKFESQMYPFPSSPKVPTKIIPKGRRKIMKWTPKENQILKRLIDKGKSYKVIAKKMGRSYDGIRMKAKKLGFKKPRKYRKKSIPNNLGFPRWTPQEEHKMIDMLSRGYKIEEVSKEINRTPKAIELRMYRNRKNTKKKGMFKWRGKKHGKNKNVEVS